jgi:ATP-dependent DNA helicase UvrD/PcrA
MQRAYIEAAPGSGKTTVAAERFGVLRFQPTRDERAVLAVSFTRSATAELSSRIRRRWGPHALTWPHRVVTLDTVWYDILLYLLRRELLYWPGGHKELVVHDTWKVRLEHQWKRQQPYLKLENSSVVVSKWWPRESDSRVVLEPFAQAIAGGECTHDDVRMVLGSALRQPAISDAVAQRLQDTTRAIIVDEVFDANELDLRLVELASERRIATSIIGDPWQALYRFRGARPEQVPALVEAMGFQRYPLTRSFRFQTGEARHLSSALRSGMPIQLPAGEVADADIVLAGRWADLWSCGADVLPLAFSSTPSNPTEAAAVLLLDRVTQSSIGLPAVFLQDALTSLGITDLDALRRLAEPLTAVLETLAADNADATERAWKHLRDVIGTESQRAFPRRHRTHIARLERLRNLLQAPAPKFVPGLTVHQAKGREWNCVAVRPTDTERVMLARGLNGNIEEHRRLYVALTRGRRRTIAI